jgi:hypothetical protein
VRRRSSLAFRQTVSPQMARARRFPAEPSHSIVSRSVSRVLYGGVHDGTPRGSHSSGTPFARRLKQPTRTTGPKTGLELLPRRPYSALLPVGFALPLPSPEARCALTAPFHPYPGEPGRYVFCGTFPEAVPLARKNSAGRYPAPCLRGARTFLGACATRLPDRLTVMK